MNLWKCILDLISGQQITVQKRFAWTGDTEPPKVRMPTNAKYATPKDFLRALRPAATVIEIKYGIPWMFAATQAAHESRYGNSVLAQKNNLFGVTADHTLKEAGIPDTMGMEAVKAWLVEHPEVPVIVMKTQEQSLFPPEKIHYWSRPGDIISKTKNGTGSDALVERPFRTYQSYDESLASWAAQIISKYPDAYQAATRANFEEFAHGLQAGGYATDAKYASQLVQLHSELEALA